MPGSQEGLSGVNDNSAGTRKTGKDRPAKEYGGKGPEQRSSAGKGSQMTENSDTREKKRQDKAEEADSGRQAVSGQDSLVEAVLRTSGEF